MNFPVPSLFVSKRRHVIPPVGIACIGGLILATLGSGCGISRGLAQETTIDVRAIPLELGEQSSGKTRFGNLTFLAGYELRSHARRFTELSGLVVSRDGRQLYAVSDQGYWLSANLHHDESGRLKGLTSWKVGNLLTPDGEAVWRKLRDAEALSQSSDGSMIVAFEKRHRIWRYPPPPAGFAAPAQVVPTPPELANAPSNAGVEALTALPDGRLFILTGGYDNPDGSLKGWIIEKDRSDPISYVPTDGLQPTDLAALSNGDVLLLERYFHRITRHTIVRLRHLKKETIYPGASVKGEVIAEVSPPLPLDNFEGLAVREDPELGTFIYIVSDDNRNPLQRTLLIQFRWDQGASSSR